jgi:hypothetical protein
MSVYAVGTPHYEWRGGELYKVQTTYDDQTGNTDEQLTPADQSGDTAAAGNEGAVGSAFTGVEGTIPSDIPALSGQLPANDPTYASFPNQGGRLGDLTGNVGQYGAGSAAQRASQYGIGPSQNAASQTYGNQGGNMPGGNSLTPEQRQAMGLPGGGIGGAPVAQGTPPNTAVDANGKPIADYLRGLDLYNPENPMVAVENVIQDMGMGRGFGNPMVSFIKKMAQGLALSYIAQNAQTPGVTGESMANAPYAFRDYLTNAIGGGAGGAGMAARGMGQGMSAMLHTASQLPALVETVRALNADKSGNITTVNPFTEMLATLLGANTGQGTASFLSNLLGPAMPRGLGDAYESGLNYRTRQGQRALYGLGPNGPIQGAPMAEGDIWTQLLGH